MGENTTSNYATFRQSLLDDLEDVKNFFMFGGPDPGTIRRDQLEEEGWEILDTPPADKGVRVFMALAPDGEVVLVHIGANEVQ